MNGGALHTNKFNFGDEALRVDDAPFAQFECLSINGIIGKGENDFTCGGVRGLRERHLYISACAFYIRDGDITAEGEVITQDKVRERLADGGVGLLL